LPRSGLNFVIAVLAVAIALCLSLPFRTTAASNAVTFTKQQQYAGGAAFEKSCALCHGEELEGGAGPPLRGQNFKILSTKVGATVGDIFTYMTTNMPMNDPASLSHKQYVNIMAFILSKNGYHAGGAPLTFAAASASKAKAIKE
jgi:polar amino acid transport system substrate-binding protein